MSTKLIYTTKVTLCLMTLHSTYSFGKLKPNHHHHNINKDSIGEIERESPYIHTPIHIGFDGTISLTFMHGHSGTHGLEYSMSPIILINGDKIKRLVKLGKQTSSVPLPIGNPNDNKGYRLIRKKAFDIGIGLAPHLGVLNLVSGVAIMGHRGKSKYYERFIRNLSDLENTNHLQVPLSKQQLQDWAVGDQLVFAHIGGISFHFFGGYDPFLFVGPAYRALGEWKVHLKKIGKNKIKYDLVNEKIYSFGAEIEGTFSKIDIEKFHIKEKYFEFIFDFSKPEIPNLFKEVLKGNLKKVQKLCNNSYPGISTFVEGISQSHGNRSSKMLSLPFLYGASKSKNKVINTSFEKDLENGYTIKTNIALREERSATFGRLSNHKLKTEFFIATHEKSMPSTEINFPDHFEDVDHEGVEEINLKDHRRNGNLKHGQNQFYHQFGGTQKWVYETDKITGDKLEKKIESLGRESGFESLKFSFPHEELGYVRIELSIMFSQGFLGKIMNLGSNSRLYHKLIKSSKKEIRNYFSLENSKNLCKNASRKNCEKKIIQNTKLVYSEIAEIIIRMHKDFSEHRFESFVVNYSKLGKTITHNRFVLQNFVRKFHRGVIVDFELFGEKFAHFKKTIINSIK
ncbi:MAG: hypothetical protein AB8G05_17990 [Oligoflexales bacterium]